MLDITAKIADQTLDHHLADWLNANYGANSQLYAQIKNSCLQGIEEGWLCQLEAGGIQYGRVFKPSDELHGYSVDVVDMNNIVGPYHAHPKGEIDLIMPIDTSALFDGKSAGWIVYPKESSHMPTVSDGRALILYLLPAGQIDFR